MHGTAVIATAVCLYKYVQLLTYIGPTSLLSSQCRDPWLLVVVSCNVSCLDRTSELALSSLDDIYHSNHVDPGYTVAAGRQGVRGAASQLIAEGFSLNPACVNALDTSYWAPSVNTKQQMQVYSPRWYIYSAASSPALLICDGSQGMACVMSAVCVLHMLLLLAHECMLLATCASSSTSKHT